MFSKRIERNINTSFTVLGPNGERADFTSVQELRSILNTAGYPYGFYGPMNTELVVFCPNGTIELEVII